MSERAQHLSQRADSQISALIEALRGCDESALMLQCPGRRRLGDGSVAAAAQHTADNYQRIAEFLTTCDQASGEHRGSAVRERRLPRLLGALRHTPPNHGSGHAGPYTARSVERDGLVEQLSATRLALAGISDLTNGQLDAIPPRGSFRFCDGQRTLAEVLGGLLKHQSRQVDAVTASLADGIQQPRNPGGQGLDRG